MPKTYSGERETVRERQMRIATGVASIDDDMRAWRRDFHSYPEIAFEEVRTSVRIAELLSSFGIQVHSGIARTGVVGTLANGRGARIMLRADIDALAIEERSDSPYGSRNAGKAHACGHDGHVAMLLGAAKYLAQTRRFRGTVDFVFQPAEEKEGGGRSMVEEGLFSRFPAGKIFGLHNWPNLPAGHFATRKGPIMAAFGPFEMQVTAKAAHAAMPHLGGDSILATAAVVNAIQSVVSRRIDPVDSVVLSVTQIHGGSTFNAIPETIRLGGCLRYFTPAVERILKDTMAETSESVAHAFGASVSLDFPSGYPPLVNADEETDDAVGAAIEVAGADKVIPEARPSTGSEDFAFMTQERPGCYIWLGNGTGPEGPGLHSPYYDFNDDILGDGARYWITLTERLLPAS